MFEVGDLVCLTTTWKCDKAKGIITYISKYNKNINLVKVLWIVGADSEHLYDISQLNHTSLLYPMESYLYKNV